MTDAIPEQLLTYLATREAQRAHAVDATLAALTERERRLVREAAVMGYVQGRRHPEGHPHPKDGATLGLVVDACLAVPDLYPIISGVLPCGECEHPQYAHREGEDPVTPGVCVACGEDEGHHDYRLGVTSSADEDPS